jgi:site-specific DNA recombinase
MTVPAIVDKDLYDAAQMQLTENRKMARKQGKWASFLLQGLMLCKHCNYAYCGRRLKCKPGINKIYNDYNYYHCTGTDATRFGGKRICNNAQIRVEILDIAVWEEVKKLLMNPNRLLEEYERRIIECENSFLDGISDPLEKQINRLKRSISKLIDSYMQEYIESSEFEPRIKEMKQRLKFLEKEREKMMDQVKLKNELKLVVTGLEHFTSCVEANLEEVDWHTKREIIKTIVKRIEIGKENVTVVFRINDLQPRKGKIGNNSETIQHCPTGRYHAHDF